MKYILKEKKQKDGSIVVHHELTNEPVATLTSNGLAGRRRTYKLGWHPDFRVVNPEIGESLLHRNLQDKYGRTHSYEAKNDLIEHVRWKVKEIQRGGIAADPVRTTPTGEAPEAASYGNDERYTHHVHDDDGNIMGKIKTGHIDTISRDSPASLHMDNKYMEEHGISEHTLNAARNKHPASSLEAVMHRARYIIDHKGEEPRFVGKHELRSSTQTYSTKLDPEKASAAYEGALRKQFGSDADKYEVTRHSPHAFTMRKPATDNERGERHDVFALPGSLHHTTTPEPRPGDLDRYDSGASKNNKIIESTQ